MKQMNRRSTPSTFPMVHKRRAGDTPGRSGSVSGGSRGTADESKHPRRKIRLPNTIALFLIVGICALLVFVSSFYDKDTPALRPKPRTRSSDHLSFSLDSDTGVPAATAAAADAAADVDNMDLHQANSGEPIEDAVMEVADQQSSPEVNVDGGAPMQISSSLSAPIEDQQQPYESVSQKDIDAFYLNTWSHFRNIITKETGIVWPKHPKGLDPFKERQEFKQLRYSTPGDPAVRENIWKTSMHPYIYTGSMGMCLSVRDFKRYGSVKRHVMLSQFDENVGALSVYVHNRTKNYYYGTGPDAWANRDGLCSREEAMEYLDHPNMLGFVTTQHHGIDHPKAHSIPLGMKEALFRIYTGTWLHGQNGITKPTPKKTQLLMINDSGWQHRAAMSARVIHNFAEAGYSNMTNTYCRGGAKTKSKDQASSCPASQTQRNHLYMEELARSKFILCPSGLGWDSYRIWDALMMMTIPIIERYERPHDGWRRTFDGLPVLWVEHVEDITPALLEREYAKIIAKESQSYQWERLTKNYWFDFIESMAKASPVDAQGGTAAQEVVTLALADAGAATAAA